jgi:Domain of unknown function (DUF6471)
MLDWGERAAALLRSEMAKRRMKYPDLVRALDAIGVQDNERNLSNKIARGTFSAGFFVQCLAAMEVKILRLDED